MKILFFCNRKVHRRHILRSRCNPASGIHGTGVVHQSVKLCQTVRLFFGNRSILSGVEVGEVFAESFACAGVGAIPLRVVAGEDSTVMCIHRDRILYSCGNACDFHRQILFNLMKVLATKNIRFHQKTQITSKRTTREKLMAYLLLEAKKHNSRRFVIPFDRQELADYLEVERSGLSAEIGKLRKEGVLKSRKNQFELL